MKTLDEQKPVVKSNGRQSDLIEIVSRTKVRKTNTAGLRSNTHQVSTLWRV